MLLVFNSSYYSGRFCLTFYCQASLVLNFASFGVIWLFILTRRQRFIVCSFFQGGPAGRQAGRSNSYPGMVLASDILLKCNP